MGIRDWLDPSRQAERKLAAEAEADAAKARERIAYLDRERRSGRRDPDWIAQERRRADDNLNYALGRGPYKEGER